MDTEITELEELGAEKVSGVASPANATPWLLLKAQDVRADPESPYTESEEADEMEETLTKDEADEIEEMLTKARFGGFCATDDCGVCQERFGPLYGQILNKAKLKAKERNALPKSQFAYVDSEGTGHLPIHDASHTRNALARFNQTHFESPEAKAKAGRKIKAKAKSFGIEVSEDANVNKDRLEKSPGVPKRSVKTPKAKGQVKRPWPESLPTGMSALTDGATDGERKDHIDPSFALGGESSYTITVEEYGKINTNPPSPPPMDRPGNLEAQSVSTMSKNSWTIEVVEKENWITMDAPTHAQDSDPGGPAWQGYDSASCDSVARGLAEAHRAVTMIRNRETAEAIAGDSSEWFDAYKLQCAAEDICNALQLVASLAYAEAADGEAQEAVKATVDHLSKSLGKASTTNLAKSGVYTSKEGNSMATITKEELDAQIARSASKAVKAAMKEMAKANKKKEKKAKMKGKPAFMMEKNANNGGDITAGEMEREVKGHHDANDLEAMSPKPEKMYVNKGQKKALKSIEQTLAELDAKVAKMAGRPRQGGPVLDGQSRGAYPASEGRATESVAKSGHDAEIERLEKSMAETHDPIAVDQISRELTLARLRKGHEQGLI